MYISRVKLAKNGMLISILSFCVLAIGVILHGTNQFKAGSQLASVNQVANLSHVLVRQQTNIFSLMLVKNAKNEDLIEALDNFAKEDFVIDANLYAPDGSLIAQSQQAKSLKQHFTENVNTQQIVEPIFAEQDLLGFLRVTFDSHYGQTTHSKINELFHRLYGELIILVLASGLFMSCIHTYWKRKTIYIHSLNNLLIEKEKKTQAQRFHSRRRVFRR